MYYTVYFQNFQSSISYGFGITIATVNIYFYSRNKQSEINCLVLVSWCLYRLTYNDLILLVHISVPPFHKNTFDYSLPLNKNYHEYSARIKDNIHTSSKRTSLSSKGVCHTSLTLDMNLTSSLKSIGNTYSFKLVTKIVYAQTNNSILLMNTRM